ncbi:hypothetical protein [Cellulomonas sp. APG4]|uniref:hypothetical protein n=1 Tax=Cellulomonas sp. APG4 TaxID=1538656 RepID=UPI001ED9055D|nr:hypothetical protein [Cellulomonas sp. APG4]
MRPGAGVPAEAPWRGSGTPGGYGYGDVIGSTATDTYGPSGAVHWLLPVGRSWQAVVAPYVGLISLLAFPLAPVAIGLGVWALARARRGGHGTGRAVFAIVTGLLGCAVGVWVLTTF